MPLTCVYLRSITLLNTATSFDELVEFFRQP